LQEISHPKPLEELLFHAYDTYRQSHPWVGDHPLSPKSVIRDMYERALSFTEYVSFYELARTEGIVLRYLASAYKALEHTVPDDLKSEDLEDLTAWLGELVRQVDSSLLDEWEQLANPEDMTADEAREKADQVKPVTANARAFRVLVRNAMFRRVELAALDERRPRLGDQRRGRPGRPRGPPHPTPRRRPRHAQHLPGPAPGPDPQPDPYLTCDGAELTAAPHRPKTAVASAAVRSRAAVATAAQLLLLREAAR
ncbi:hypothetical protein ADL35_38725, partial [Streptomyces sp. NRRL WC-3753]